MEKRRKIRIGVCAAAAAGVLGAAVFFGTHTYLCGRFFPKNAPALDLTRQEITADDYETLRSRFPDTAILWSVPFQGTHLPSGTEAVAVTSLTDADIAALSYLPELRQVDARSCTDYDAILSLIALRPDCRVDYQVPLGGVFCPGDATEATVADADVRLLTTGLPYLPKLKTLTLEGKLPDAEALAALRTSFPGISVRYSVSLCGRSVPSDAAVLDLSGLSPTREALEAALPYLPELETIAPGTLPEEDAVALAKAFPEVFFLFCRSLSGQSFSTDAEELDLTGGSISREKAEEILFLFRNLKKLVLSDCGLDNETLDALNRQHPEVSVIWTVQVGIHKVRTDATVFFPAGVSEKKLPGNEDLKNLRYCTSLIAMDLGHCRITECGWLRELPHLRYLILADTEISDLSPLSGLKELIYLELFRTPITDYSPLLGCTALQDLNLSFTYGDVSPIGQMTWLHNLHWNPGADHPELRTQIEALSETLQDTVIETEPDRPRRSIGGSWRYLPNYYVFRDLIGGAFLNQGSPYHYWGEDAKAILACAKSEKLFAGDVLAEIVRRRMDEGLPIPGIKNVGSEKAEILYQSLVSARP